MRWSLVRNPTSGSRAALGLIPKHHALFSSSRWFLGICDADVAFRYLMSDRSAQRPGVFVIFSPFCLNPDPSDYRPFLLMCLCERVEKIDGALSYDCKDLIDPCGSEFYSRELELCNCSELKKEQLTKDGQAKKKEKKRRSKIKAMGTPDEQQPLADAAIITAADDEEKDMDKIAELITSPFTYKMLTITRSAFGHYELFGKRYHTLYDLVYHLSQTDSELPQRLVYETLSMRVL
ncbi:unnamed protein product [Strongylus vulgaris]|uniref:Uncharacterized protein n=1 Tax=Strongylus vulgaris TaxID=40348 RepID=A0A3P7KBH7_STRVU|nr:unnamed protein product [Strongylus vulgaris]